MTGCATAGCTAQHLARGFCAQHYDAERRSGRLAPLPKPDPVALFWAKVEKTPTCWLWRGALKPNGYGYFGRNASGKQYSHRYAYQLLVDEIPDGLHLDHLCGVRNCVRPDHLEAVTQAENNRRAVAVRVQRRTA